jgi:hypothetical protein
VPPWVRLGTCAHHDGTVVNISYWKMIPSNALHGERRCAPEFALTHAPPIYYIYTPLHHQYPPVSWSYMSRPLERGYAFPRETNYISRVTARIPIIGFSTSVLLLLGRCIVGCTMLPRNATIECQSTYCGSSLTPTMSGPLSPLSSWTKVLFHLFFFFIFDLLINVF